MADSFFDKLIADLVKGASHHLRENGGVGVNILVDRENHGHEEKLAALDLGTLLKSPLGGAVMGAGAGGLTSLISGDDHPLRDMGIGAGLGALHGHTSGRLDAHEGGFKQTGRSLADLTDKTDALKAMQGVHGDAITGHDYDLGHLRAVHNNNFYAQDRFNKGLTTNAPRLEDAGSYADVPERLKYRSLGRAGTEVKQSALEQRYTDGVKSAAEALGIKEAFLPLLGSLLGGTALRAGASALARGAGGKMLGGLASKALPHMAGGIGGAATDMLGSMGGSALGSKLMPQRQQQPQGAVPPPPM